MRGDTKVPGCPVPVFQLLQWKHAIGLEITLGKISPGARPPFGRSVSAHAKQRLGLPRGMKREVVVAIIEGVLVEFRARQHAAACSACYHPIIDDEGNPGYRSEACADGAPILEAYISALAEAEVRS